MTDFLDTEIDEINAVRAALGEEVLNKWFDKSPIKDRFKKARVKDQMLRCCYCRKFNATIYANEWDLEHILCEEIYPQFFATPGNLAIACKRCNGVKRDTDVYAAPARPHLPPQTLPTQSYLYSIPHPRLDDWTEHLSHVNYQIYTSKSSKGLELLEVCKLNEPAINDAGLTREQVVTAVRTNFFDTMGNLVDPHISDDHMLVAVSGFTERLERMRAETFIAGLDVKIRKLGQKAAARTVEQAVATAKALVEKKPTRLLQLE